MSWSALAQRLETKIQALEVDNGNLTTQIHYLKVHAGELAKRLSKTQVLLAQANDHVVELEEKLLTCEGE